MSQKSFDLIVVGGGPGGYVAAIRASQLGMKVGVIEREHLGGICLNWGCIPTKALLRSAEVYSLIKHADQFGLFVDKVGFDLDKVVKRSRTVSGQLNKGVNYLLQKNNVTVIEGDASLAGNKRVKVKDKKGKEALYSADHIILATGARARELDDVKADGDRIWTYMHAMVPKELPKSLVIVGSGAIGIEFASFYRSFGVEVTVLEMMPTILPVEDDEISKLAQKQFEAQGIQFKTEAKLTKVSKNGKGLSVEFDHKGKKEKLNPSHMILAIGIVGNVEGLNLESTKVKVDRGHIQINEWCETAERGIYAIGDVAGPPWLAHKASHEGVICVEKIAGKNHVEPLKTDNIPGCTYSMPQIASVGITEKEAKAKGLKFTVGRFPFKANGKAIALGETEGLIKTIFEEKTGELLGAHMVGAEVTEMIQGYGIAKTLETTEADLMHTIFPHPTLSEMMHESVLDAYNQAIHF